VIVAIIITVGPLTNASLNPARSFGPLFVETIAGGVHNWLKFLGVYLVACPIGAIIAAYAYDLIATPRKVQRPIREAVSELDRAPDPATMP